MKNFLWLFAFLILATPCFPIAPYLNKEVYPIYPSLKPILDPLIFLSVIFAASLPCISMIWIIALLASLARKPVYIPETNGGSKITSANITHYNPWISIWFLPRATIRQIVSTKPDEHVTFLAIMFGIYTVLNFFYGQNFSIDLILQLAISVAIGGVLGYVAVRVFSKMLHWRGQRSGGRAKPDEVRAAVAWSTVPSLFLLLVLIPAIILNSRFATIDRTSFIVILFLISLVLLLWRAIILINCIAEINHLSLWEGLKIVFILWPFVLMVLGNLPINIP